MKFDEPLGIILQVDSKMIEVQQAQQFAEIKNQARRHAERMAQFEAWVDPDAVTARLKKHAEDAVAALERAKRMVPERNEEEIPIPDPLPAHMKGQALSTIRRMLQHERGKTEEPQWNFGMSHIKIKEK